MSTKKADSKKKVLTPEEKEAAKVAKEKEAEAKKAEKDAKLGAGKDEVVVFDEKTRASRTYSKKEHGADFRKLAEEFASKVATRKVL